MAKRKQSVQAVDPTTNPASDCFDQGMRYLIKRNPNGTVRWTSRRGDGPPLKFIAWDDARTVVVSGGPERVSDMIAKCETLDELCEKYRVQYESQTRSEKGLIIRFLVYQCLHISNAFEQNQNYSHYLCAFVLADESVPDQYRSTPQHVPYGSSIKIQTIIVRHLDAAEILAEIEQDEAPEVFLPIIPLMQNCESPTIIERWKSQVGRVSDPSLASDIVVLTKTFANKSKHKAVWHNALEGWNMTDSPFLNEYILKGEQKGFLEGQKTTLRESVALALNKRFKNKVTNEISTRINEESNPTILQNWLSLVLEVDSWDEFQTRFNRKPRSKRREVQTA